MYTIVRQCQLRSINVR